MIRRERIFVLLVLAVVGISSCSNEGTPPPPPPPSGNISVTVAPATISVRIGQTQQFTATVTGTSNSAVTWSVNGVQNGNATVGTVTATGFYTPPATLPANNTLNITATSVAQTSAVGTSTTTLLNPSPVVAAVTPNQVTPGTFVITVSGTGFLPSSAIGVNGQMVATTFVSPIQLSATITLNPGQTSDDTITVVNPNPGAIASPGFQASLTPGAVARNLVPAARFLDQATFGYTAADVPRVNQLGMSAWIDEQFTLPMSPWPEVADNLGPGGSFGFPPHCTDAGLRCAKALFFQNAIRGQDQLRQRVAWALEQIWVVSAVTVTHGNAHMNHMRLMNINASGNYRDVMRDVTLSGGMGWFQDIANNDGQAGTLPNENYARELLQLFTIGTVMLNIDGSVQLDVNNQPIPAYTEENVRAFARVNTGWTFPARTGSEFWNHRPDNTVDWSRQLVTFENRHDVGPKDVLQGVTLPPGQTARAELDDALDNIFQHPNVGPFVSKQLIQRLVTSNPSPAYVARVATVFNNNGSGVRGDMQAVVKAILLDPEARRGDAVPVPPVSTADGKLKEPVLMLTGILRTLDATPVSTAAFPGHANLFALTITADIPRPDRAPTVAAMGQNLLSAPTVFNFYPPDFVIPGTTLIGPEFQIYSTATATLRNNFMDFVVRNAIEPTEITVAQAMDRYTGLAANPELLLDRLNLDFLRGQMTLDLRQAVAAAVNAIPAANAAGRARTAVYLVATSPQYQALP